MSDFLGDLRAWLNIDIVTIGHTNISVSTIITLAFIVLGSFWISKLLRKVTLTLLDKRHPAAASTLGALIHYAVLIVGFSIALSTAGVNLTGLFAAGAIFAVGIGFAMQSIVQNFVSGIILLAERSIKPGDILEVEGMVVRVAEMGIRASLVQSRDGEDIIIPNSILAQNSVKNYTLRDSNFRIRGAVGVSYSSDMKRVRDVLETVATQMSERWGVPGKAPNVVMISFGSSSVDWEIGVWMNDPWEYRMAKSDLNEHIWNAFKDHDIVIAFPQIDLHLDVPVSESLQRLSSVPR